MCFVHNMQEEFGSCGWSCIYWDFWRKRSFEKWARNCFRFNGAEISKTLAKTLPLTQEPATASLSRGRWWCWQAFTIDWQIVSCKCGVPPNMFRIKTWQTAIWVSSSNLKSLNLSWLCKKLMCFLVVKELRVVSAVWCLMENELKLARLQAWLKQYQLEQGWPNWFQIEPFWWSI